MPLYAKVLIGMAVGAVIGLVQYRLVGCSTGACPLTSNPWVSMIYGMSLGGLVGGSFQ